MFAPLLAPAHLPGLIVSGTIALAAAILFATTGPDTASESHGRGRKQSRRGRNTKSTPWWKGLRGGSWSGTPSAERGSPSAARGHLRSLPLEVLEARAAAALRHQLLEDRAGGWASPAEARMAEAAALLPAEVWVTLDDVVGLEAAIENMRLGVVAPLRRQEASAGALSEAVLLHGPTGCGKRTLALAVAREAGAAFVDARAALDRWQGPAAEGAALVWGVAAALQPAVLYVEGVESLLGVLGPARAAAAAVRVPSAALGRGYCGASGNDVVLIGATEQMANLDPEQAAQFPLRLSVPAPGAAAREALLARFLFQECSRMKLCGPHVDLWKAGGVGGAEVPATLTLRTCAARTEGFSGSALRELARRAVELGADEAVAEGAGADAGVDGSHLAQALRRFVPLYAP